MDSVDRAARILASLDESVRDRRAAALITTLSQTGDHPDRILSLKASEVPTLPQICQMAIRDYLETAGRADAPNDQYVFTLINSVHPLNAQMATAIIHEAAMKAGVDTTSISMDSLRRLQELFQHSSTGVTAEYARQVVSSPA